MFHNSYEEIRRVLRGKPSLFAGKYLLVLAAENWTDLGWDAQDHLTKKQMYVTSDAIFSANPGTREWALGRRDSSVDAFIAEFGALKPCIHGSDAHSFHRICRPDQDRFCWIKAAPTFDGLKQIIHEPEDRVAIQADDPEPRKNIYTLGSAEIANGTIRPGLAIPDQQIALAPGLVAVIGGKGSGKTALLDLIAHLFEDRRARATADPNSFIQRIEASAPHLWTSVNFRSGESFGKYLDDDLVFGQTRLTYLPQGKIEQYSGDESKLHDEILRIIFRHPDVQVKREELRGARREAKEAADALVELHREIARLREESDDAALAIIAKQKLETEGALKDLGDKRTASEEAMAADAQERVGALEAQATKTFDRVGALHSAGEQIAAIGETLATIGDLNREMTRINESLGQLKIQQRLPELDVVRHTEVVVVVVAALEAQVKLGEAERERISAEIDELSGQEKQHAGLLEEIQMTNADLLILEADLAEVARKRAETIRLDVDRRARYHALVAKHHEVGALYEFCIEAFSTDKDDIMKDISFQSGIRFDYAPFTALGEDIIDQRKAGTDRVRELADAVLSFTNAPPDAAAINAYLMVAEALALSLKGTRTREQFDAWVFGDYFSLTTGVAFSGVP